MHPLLAIDGCIDPAATNGKVNILRPRSIGDNLSGVTKSANPGRIGRDAIKSRVIDGTTGVSTRVPAIAPIRIRPGADGGHNPLPIVVLGNMGIVPRYIGTMIAIRQVLLLDDSMKVAETGGMLTIGQP